MIMKDRRAVCNRPARRGFTLIELLVVVAVIALLVSILLPSLARARELAQSAKCKANQYGLGRSIEIYLTEYGVYPASYLYRDGTGRVPSNLVNQNDNHPGGYLHWSYHLLGDASTSDATFACPSFRNDGLPRTNPGPRDKNNWERGQTDQNGASLDRGWNGTNVEDQQAARVAYTGNASLLIRNKFTTGMSGGPRINQFVRGEEVNGAASTILLAEFNNDWEKISVAEHGGRLSKSHRPVTPIVTGGASSSNSVFSPDPRLTYGEANYHYYGAGEARFNLSTVRQLDSYDSALSGHAELDAVGRHHGGNRDDGMGGESNFLFADGHVETMHVLDTLEQRMWGDRFYGVTGDTRIVGFFD